ncbi:histidine phosphatase family protein [Suttonella sp. R2A3]|uniref:histidine phosphatase family protein n=1 Tax=Suttonella sp. R2A3 TaxID=2908648 RepID=UPI001F1A9EE0|nr:histidine phosphatase family protein [Suttonella sp. R2A3]UJF23705.1 histidine phosphatase family protein [Suttonella sp. R2A3]
MPAIYIIRHAESTTNIGELSRPNPVVPLTTKGREQARKLAERLTIEPSEVIVSEFIRTRQTAQPWLDKLGLDAREDGLINEFNMLGYSMVEGMTGEQRRPIASRYWRKADLNARCGEDGETFNEFTTRVNKFLNTLAERRDNSVLFSHGMFIRLLMWRLLGYPMHTAHHLKLFQNFHQGSQVHNTAVFRLHWQTGREDAAIRILPQFTPEAFITR